MNFPIEGSSYILGQTSQAEYRLKLLNELTASPFVEAMKVLPSRKVRIINIGCGSGHLEERLAKLFSNSHFVCIDISPQRIKETRARLESLTGSNTYEFIEADLTNLSVEDIEPCDILISRFVLSHLRNGLAHFGRFLTLVKPGGSICFEEAASEGHEYYSNSKNEGYANFVKMVPIQIQAQQSSFEIGFLLLNELTKRSWNVVHCGIDQPILRSQEQKSILRLGMEEARAVALKYIEKQKFDDTLRSLQEFEKDSSAIGLYTRYLFIIAKSMK
jgi:SAM-dependent methyltransferase